MSKDDNSDDGGEHSDEEEECFTNDSLQEVIPIDILNFLLTV
jgi:hypothetical protein